MSNKSAAVIDYKMGNIKSLINALKHIEIKSAFINNPKELKNFSHIILPGVGSSNEAYRRLSSLGFLEYLKESVYEKNTKLLGICVGMQVLGKSTEEDGGSAGLNFVDNMIKKLPSDLEKKMKVPHVGFNEVVDSGSSSLLKGLTKNSDFYFVHSYGMEVLNKDYEKGVTHHSNSFVSLIEKGSVYGTQFHPEKSQTNGLNLLRNFFR